MNFNKKIFIWKDSRTWKIVLEEIFSNVLTPSVIDEIKQNKDKIKYMDDRDNFSFIDKYHPDFRITKDHVSSFINQYAYIRMYHACRPLDVSTYYDKGFKVLTTQEFDDIFKLIYLNDTFPELTKEDMEQAISSTRKKLREGVIHFLLDDRFLISCANHYLKFGSEYLQALAAELGRIKKNDYKAVLGTIGFPTIFEINLPIEFIERGGISELLLNSLTQWVYNVAHSNSNTMELDFTVTIKHDVSAEYIVNHYYPKL